jgi:K+-sensing histidine kinase KdpD
LIRRYAIAISFVTIAFAMELLLQRFFPHLFLFQFFAAIVASAWYGGMGPAMLTVVVSILAVDYFFLPPVKSFVVDTTAGAYLASFVVAALAGNSTTSLKKCASTYARSRIAAFPLPDRLELNPHVR